MLVGTKAWMNSSANEWLQDLLLENKQKAFTRTVRHLHYVNLSIYSAGIFEEVDDATSLWKEY